MSESESKSDTSYEFVQFENPTEFLLDSVTISGMREKYGNISFKPSADVKERIAELVAEHDTCNPISRGWLNLKIEKGALTDKHKNEILNKGRMIVKIKFSYEGVFTVNDKSHLKSTAIGVKKVDDVPVVKVLDDI